MQYAQNWLADIGTKNVSEHDITPRKKYIMVGLEK